MKITAIFETAKDTDPYSPIPYAISRSYSFFSANTNAFCPFSPYKGYEEIISCHGGFAPGVLYVGTRCFSCANSFAGAGSPANLVYLGFVVYRLVGGK